MIACVSGDVLEIRRLRMPVLYDIRWRKPAPLVPRNLRLEVNERVDKDGNILAAPDMAEVALRVDALAAAGVESIAVCLLRGKLTAADYEDEAATDPRIDRLRALMTVTENPAYTARYDDPVLRANPNGIEIVFKDGSGTGLIEHDNPVGHPSRRSDGIPLLINKLSDRLRGRYETAREQQVRALCADHPRFLDTAVPAFTDLLAQ